MNIKVRAAIRTTVTLAMIGVVSTVVYIFAILGMLPGVIILCGIGLVFVMYDTNKTQIEYEDKLDEMVRNNEKKML